MIDLRVLYPPLHRLLSSSPSNPSLGPLKSYPHLTELTRNPANTRGPVEKNWMLFFTISGESYIHYDLSNPRRSDQGRTFAKVIGGGLTTVNLTDPLELPCIHENDEEPDKARTGGTWHQATNSLRLILCTRSDTNCKPSVDNTVFFAAVHRKIENDYELPLRYERFFVVWSAFPPFGMIGISQHPILMANETALGWSASDNWDDDAANAKLVAETKIRNGTSDPFGGKDYWAHFTYTVSIAYAWGRHKDGLEGKNVGYLDDEVVLGIGIDDNGQGFARVEARDLVQCLRACPGRRMRSTMRAG